MSWHILRQRCFVTTIKHHVVYARPGWGLVYSSQTLLQGSCWSISWPHGVGGPKPAYNISFVHMLVGFCVPLVIMFSFVNIGWLRWQGVSRYWLGRSSPTWPVMCLVTLNPHSPKLNLITGFNESLNAYEKMGVSQRFLWIHVFVHLCSVIF